MILGWNMSANNMLTIWKNVLKEHHKIYQDWEGKQFADIDLQWHYAVIHLDRTLCLSVKHYIADLLLKPGNLMPKKPQLSPQKCKIANYGSRIKMAPEADDSKPLDVKGILLVQQVVGALLWVGRAVSNTLLVSLSTIGSQQASAT